MKTSIKNIIAAAVVALCASVSQGSVLITPPLPLSKSSEKAATLSNNNLRLSFVKAGNGGNALACMMETRVDGIWQPFASMMEDNKVFVITGPKKLRRPGYKSFYPSWKNGDSISTNPYLSGDVCEAVPVKARNIDKQTIEVEYATAGNHTVRGYWTLSKKGHSATLRLEFTPAEAGCYSLGVSGLHAVRPSEVTNLLMPPMFQYRRFPEQPLMMLSVMMPVPAAMVETTVGDKPVTAYVSADRNLPQCDWGGVDHAPIGFSLKNHDNMPAPTAFAPVLGMNDSRMKQGETIVRNFEIGLAPLSWNETLEYLATETFGVTDYRKQDRKSLTETMFSIIDLMADDDFGGWNPAMKGPYDIEGKPTKAPTVVQSSPLAIVGAAINSADEELYLRRALPTIEYTLSRKGYRWSTRTTDGGYNKDPETLRLSPIGSQFTTSYYDGLDRLLGKRNAWLRDIALPEGELRKPKGYSSPILSWVQALAAWRMTGDPKWLRRARTTAERDAKMHIYANSEKPMRYQAFYNSTIYSPWWDFIDLYEATGERQFLDAARYGSAHTIAGVRAWPAVADSTQTIHTGNTYEGNTTMWWKGSEQFRLGFPRTEGDAPEHEVEQWLVSPVGLGFEQPSTYFLRNKGKLTRPVFMNSWAPAMLRLNRHTGLDIFDTYARNAVIGRFTNYPGYYATGYTDLTLDEEFPYKGPDVSSIYYHHIPPHLAFTADYLVSEAIQRTSGKVDFPYGRQEGFVWFSNRIYGGEPGKVFDDKNVSLWMKKGLVESSNPEVNYLTAVSDSRFWILLSNESREEVSTKVRLKDASAVVAGNAAGLYSHDGSRKKIELSQSGVEVKIGPKGFKAVSIPLDKKSRESDSRLQAILDTDRIPVLDKGYVTAESGTAAGKIHLFRIRSPFGWDSVYGFCETPPADGIKVVAGCGDKVSEIPAYPYEWSFTHFSPDEKIKVSVEITDLDGTVKSHDLEI